MNDPQTVAASLIARIRGGETGAVDELLGRLPLADYPGVISALARRQLRPPARQAMTSRCC
jgi:hypothetical protein